MSNTIIPVNIINLNAKEQSLFEEAHFIIQSQPRLGLHLECIERAMTVATLVVQLPSDHEDYYLLVRSGSKSSLATA